MAILGIDFGAKKIGLAKSDSHNTFAMPFGIIKETEPGQLLSKLSEIIKQEEITELVVGKPVSLKGDQKNTNAQLKTVNDFVIWLKNNFSLPVFEQDERLTSRQAKNLILDSTQKGDDDAVAAMLILQSYLDQKKLK